MTKLVLYHTCTCLQHIRVNVQSRKEKAQFLGIFICAQSGFIQGCIFLCVSLGWDGGRGSWLRLVKRLYRCLPFNFLCRIIVSSRRSWFFVWRWVFFWEISVRCEIICHSLSTMHVIMYIILDHSRYKVQISLHVIVNKICLPSIILFSTVNLLFFLQVPFPPPGFQCFV